MKLTALFLGISLVFLSSCKKDRETNTEIPPECIRFEIIDFSHFGSCAACAKVNEYTFQCKPVYTLYKGECGADLTVAVLDANCNTLGYLGGRSQNTQINGEEFSKAKYIRTIWNK